MVPMERLLEAWRADPREEPTVELCAMLIRAVLKATGQKILPDQFVIDFVNEATTEHAKSVEVAIACSDLYLATGLFSHSKSLLEAASEAAPRDLRVKERLLKLSRIRRPTKELASRGEDPETLDAPTTPLDPETEPVKTAGSVPPSPILLPRNPRRQHTVHGLAPAPSRKPTVQGVQSPLAADTTSQGPPNLEGPDTSTTTVGKEPPPRRTPPPGLRLPNTRPTPPPGQLPSGLPPPPQPARSKSDPPTRTSVDARPSDEGPPTHVDNAPPAGARRSLPDDEGPATQAPTLVGPRGGQNEEGPPTKVGPDGPPTAVKRSAPPPATPPIASPIAPPVEASGPGRPPPRRAAIKRPPGRPGAPDSGPRTPPPASPQRPQAPMLAAQLGPLEDSHSEQEIPTKVTALPPLGPHGLALEPKTGVRTPPPPAPPPMQAMRPPMEPAPISDAGDDEPPTQARSLAPPAPPPPHSDAGDRPTRARPVVPPPRIPAAPESDPDGDTATGVKDLSSSQEAPTLSGALTKPFSRPPPAPVDMAWQNEAAFPAPGGAFHAEPAGAVGKGGTNVMNVGPAPGEVPSFSDPAPVDQQGGRTHVLSVQEAFAAAQIDPRSPHSHAAEPVGMLARGQALSPGYPSSAPPAPTFGPPPSIHPGALYESAPAPPAPSFGPPPVSVSPGPAMMSSPPSFDAPPLAQAGPSFAPPGAFPDPFAQSAPDPFAQGAMDPYAQPAMPQLPSALPFPKQPAYEPPSRSFRLYVALGVAVVAVASLVGYATYLVLGDAPPTESLPIANRPIPEELGKALLAGGPSDLLRADALLRNLEGNGAPEILLARVRERALTALEVNGEPAGIEGAVKAARGAGVPDADLAFAEIIEALLSGKEDRALEIAKANEAERTRDPYFALAHAALLERRGDPLAEERLRAAVAIEPGMRSASVRLARFLILQGKGDEAKAIYGPLPDADPARKALDALAAARGWLDARTPGAKPPAEPAVITAEIPRSLHPIFSAVKLLADAEDAASKKVATGKSNAEAQAQLKRAIDESDSPALALFFGEIALARRDEVTAFAAASRALALAPGYPSALTVLSRASVSLGKLDQLDKLLEGLPPESTIGLRAFSAYEQGNTEALAKLGQSLTEQTDPGGVVRVRLARVRGTAPISSDAIDKLLKADPIAGDLCAVDALLDAGDLARAREIVNGWPDASSHPLRAGRAARLLRYEGKGREAATALVSAAAGRAVLVERIMLGAETDAGREQARSLIDERLGQDRPFWQAYVLAKSGEVDKAKSMLEVATPPVFDSPLASRVAAVLAYAETGDVTRGEPIARVLLESFPKNPDVKRAAKSLGIEEKR